MSNSILLDDETIYIYEFNKIKNYIKDKNKINIEVSDIKIDDVVCIEFIPYSQKYLNELYPKCGKVISINNINNEYFNMIIKNLDGCEEELLHQSVSYLGDSLGYSYSIYKII
jgi:predicted metalloenzyme YecM